MVKKNLVSSLTIKSGTYPIQDTSFLDYVSPNMFDSLAECFQYAQDNNRAIKLERLAEYEVTSPITVTRPITIYGNFATIKNSTNNNYALVINHPEDRHTYIENIIFNCNGRGGLEFNGRTSNMKNLIFYDIGSYGFHNAGGYELVCDSFYFNSPFSNATAVLNDTGDCHYTNFIGLNCLCAFELNAGAEIARAHFWMGNADLYNDSIMIKSKGFNVVNILQSNCDTYGTFIDFIEGVAPAARVIDCIAVYNASFLTAQSQTYLFKTHNLDNSPFLDRIRFSQCNFDKPTIGSYAITNELNPILTNFKSSLSRMDTRNNDCVSLTSLFSNFTGQFDVKYGEYIIINGYFKGTGTTTLASLESPIRLAGNVDHVYYVGGEYDVTGGTIYGVIVPASGSIHFKLTSNSDSSKYYHINVVLHINEEM